MTCLLPLPPERRLSPELRRPSFVVGLLICGAAIPVVDGGCKRAEAAPAFIELAEARQLATDMRVAFAKAAGASDRAVMADTDDASIAFAREATQETEAVEHAARALALRLKSLGYLNETRFLEQFTGHFSEYRKLDREVLQLAVENTNLKAQRLSFGPVREAADALRDSLETVSRAAPAKDRCSVEALVATALLAVRQIQVLQAPHIAESNDATMDRLEKEMTGLQASARDALTRLGRLDVPSARPALAKATAALTQFEGLSGQIVILSRRNSNVRSLALSLGRKPALTAACDASLAALVEALAKEGSTATR